jgi:DNA-binding response OmpR family regulator
MRNKTDYFIRHSPHLHNIVMPVRHDCPLRYVMLEAVGSNRGETAVFTVLVIEDDAGLRFVLQQLLKRLDCQPITVGTGRQGEALALELHPHLILVDILLPDQDGYVTCRNLRAQGYTGIITLISVLPEDMVERHNGEANGYLQKPLTKDTLYIQIQALRSA